MEIAQLNCNHSRFTQDLLLAFLQERGLGVAIISEPARPPLDDPKWFISLGSSPQAAIFINNNLLNSAKLLVSRPCFVALNYRIYI
ncbi:hypothetical protein P5V15_011459 [Pogonomyrmex californicus]